MSVEYGLLPYPRNHASFYSARMLTSLAPGFHIRYMII